MEKLFYCLWRPETVSPEEFSQSLRTTLVEQLEGLGAQGLRLFVADSDVAAGAGLRLSAEPAHKEAALSFWLEASQDRAEHEERIASIASRMAGYLVVESRPLLDASVREVRGERRPGWVQVTGIVPRSGISYDAFLRHWYDVHRDLAIETQSSTRYVRNEVVRPLTEGAPEWAAIVEETFPLGALSDPHIFYDAEGSDERLRENSTRMIESVQVFLDISQVDAHPMSEYVFGGER